MLPRGRYASAVFSDDAQVLWQMRGFLPPKAVHSPKIAWPPFSEVPRGPDGRIPTIPRNLAISNTRSSPFRFRTQNGPSRGMAFIRDFRKMFMKG